MRRSLILLTLVAGIVAACSGSAATVAPPAATPAPPTPAAQTPAAQTSAIATPAAQTPAPADPTATPGTGSGTGGAPATPAACSLLTADQAAAALGVAVNPGAPAVDPKENVCSFGGHALADMLKFVEIEVVNPVEFTPTRASVSGVFEITAAPGIGDSAYFQKDILPNNSGTRMSLSVSKGQTVIRLDMVLPGASDAQVMAAEKTLAAAALSHL